MKVIDGGKAVRPTKPASNAVILDLEKSLVSTCFLAPSAIPDVIDVLEPGDLSPPRRALFNAIADQYQQGFPSSFHALLDDLDRSGKLDQAGGGAEVYDLTAGRSANASDTDIANAAETALDDARRLRRIAIESAVRLLADQVAQGDRNEVTLKRMRDLEEQLIPLNTGALDLDDLGFSGDRLKELRKRPEIVSPFPKLFPPEPGLIVLNAKPKTGKTSFAGFIAQAWACGVSPWEGAPVLPGSRALILNAEQPLVRVDATLRRLDTLGNSSRAKWTERVSLVARDRELSKSAERMLTLDGTGRRMLKQALIEAQRASDPFGLVVLDSMSRLVPDGLDENSNSEVSAWLAPLQKLAEELETYIVVIHHVGHAEGRGEARTAGRGASAIAAVPQAIWLLETSRDDPRQRRLHVQANAIPENRLTFAVCGEDNEPGEILYWRPADPMSTYDPAEILAETEEISTSELAARIQDPPPDGNARANQASMKTARTLRNSWERAGVIDVRVGRHSAKLLRLKHTNKVGGTD